MPGIKLLVTKFDLFLFNLKKQTNKKNLKRENANEALRMLAKHLRIFINAFRTFPFIHKQCAEFLASPFRMLRIPTNAFGNVANASERDMNENITNKCLPIFSFRH